MPTANPGSLVLICSQCGKPKEVVQYRSALWCLACRTWDLQQRPALPQVGKRQREVLVVIEKKAYRFPSKAKARRDCRSLLHRQRLPSEIVQQIEAR